MASKRKWCRVWIEVPGSYGNGTSRARCSNKIKPGTPFCREHFETHKLVEVKCTGEAHSNPFIDHCMVCLPHWGHYPVAVEKNAPGEPWLGSWE